MLIERGNFKEWSRWLLFRFAKGLWYTFYLQRSEHTVALGLESKKDSSGDCEEEGRVGRSSTEPVDAQEDNTLICVTNSENDPKTDGTVLPHLILEGTEDKGHIKKGQRSRVEIGKQTQVRLTTNGKHGKVKRVRSHTRLWRPTLERWIPINFGFGGKNISGT